MSGQSLTKQAKAGPRQSILGRSSWAARARHPRRARRTTSGTGSRAFVGSKRVHSVGGARLPLRERAPTFHPVALKYEAPTWTRPSFLARHSWPLQRLVALCSPEPFRESRRSPFGLPARPSLVSFFHVSHARRARKDICLRQPTRESPSQGSACHYLVWWVLLRKLLLRNSDHSSMTQFLREKNEACGMCSFSCQCTCSCC